MPTCSPWSARSCCAAPAPSAAATASSSATSWSAKPPTTRCPSRPGPCCTRATPPGWPSPCATRGGEVGEVRGWHLEQAYRPWPKPARWTPAAAGSRPRPPSSLAEAGHVAGRGDLPAAANLLEQAIALLEPTDRDRLGLLTDLGESWSSTSRPTRPRAGPGRGPGRRRPHRRPGAGRPPPWASWSCGSTRPTVAPTAIGPTCNRSSRWWRGSATSRARRAPGGCWAWTATCARQIGQAEDEFQRAVEHARAAGDERIEAGNLYALVQAAFWGPTRWPRRSAAARRSAAGPRAATGSRCRRSTPWPRCTPWPG